MDQMNIELLEVIVEVDEEVDMWVGVMGLLLAANNNLLLYIYRRIKFRQTAPLVVCTLGIELMTTKCVAITITFSYSNQCLDQHGPIIRDPYIKYLDAE